MALVSGSIENKSRFRTFGVLFHLTWMQSSGRENYQLPPVIRITGAVIHDAALSNDLTR